MKNKKKILIFRGGGYDGCFWEWNALIFEGTKLAKKQLVTGRYGKLAQARLESLGVFKGVRSLIAENFNSSWSTREDSKPFLIRTDDDWKYFSKEWNAGFVRTVAKAAERECRCDRCNRFFDPEEIYHTGYRGDGGIGVQFDDNKCDECAREEHYEYIREEWKTLRVATRVEAIQNARKEGYEVSVFAARRPEMPAIPADCVWEPEFY